MRWRAIVMMTLLSLPLAAVTAVTAAAQRFATSAGPVAVTRIADGLESPWAVGFLPAGRFLITERDSGEILLFEPDGRRRKLSGGPEIAFGGQGGLLDLVPARDFPRTRMLFLSWSEAGAGGKRTVLGAARLSDDHRRLENLRVLFRIDRGSRSERHFGSRIVEDRSGNLFLTIGDRGDRDSAQDPATHQGKIIRIARDGAIPADNPYVNGAALPEIWSLGHRNPQGAALDDKGRLWTVSHGAAGGDEINRPEAGKNYGWPVISYGRHYSGGRIGVGTHAPGMAQPVYFWDPSIAPSGMMIYSGKLFPRWRGSIFVGSLKYDHIARLDRADTAITGEERLFDGAFERIRDVREGPEGGIWFLSVGDGALYRATPAK